MAENNDVQIRVLPSLWLFDPLQEFLVGAFTSNQPKVMIPYYHKSISCACSDKAEVPRKPNPWKRRVRFDPNTRVYVIPSYADYSADERKRIWTSSVDLVSNAQRNRREFSSERWDWQQVKEESEMFFDKSTQEYIHPIHLGGLKGLT